MSRSASSATPGTTTSIWPITENSGRVESLFIFVTFQNKDSPFAVREGQTSRNNIEINLIVAENWILSYIVSSFINTSRKKIFFYFVGKPIAVPIISIRKYSTIRLCTNVPTKHSDSCER